jgi:hypothetical protein
MIEWDRGDTVHNKEICDRYYKCVDTLLCIECADKAYFALRAIHQAGWSYGIKAIYPPEYTCGICGKYWDGRRHS